MPQYAVMIFERVAPEDLPPEVMEAHGQLPERIAELGGREVAGMALHPSETATSIRGGVVTAVKKQETIEGMLGAGAFAVLLDAVRDCITAGASKAPSPLAATTALWVALHGYVTLRAATREFPWPDTDEVLESLITRLTWIEPTLANE